jgi:hypothetical protein
MITKDTKLQNIQFKLLHRMLPVKCGLKETELCTFCMETKENMLHEFLAYFDKPMSTYLSSLFINSLKLIVFGILHKYSGINCNSQIFQELSPLHI